MQVYSTYHEPIPVGAVYDPYGYQDGYGYQDPYAYDAGYGMPYSNAYSNGSILGPVMVSVTDQLTNGYVSDLLGQAVAAGYQQGVRDGQLAMSYGYADQGYYDPYAYNGVVYDTYSSSMAERRRWMSEGYEMGYRDA